jgi:hypothetical protein
MTDSFTEERMGALVGHRFPGGTYRIEHWENWLLTDCTGREQLPDGLVHPVALFHVPILGAGVTITEIFGLCGVSGAGSVGLEGYDWEYVEPLTEEIEYRMDGGIVSCERTTDASGRTVDRMAFEITLSTPDGKLVARVTNRWVLRR